MSEFDGVVDEPIESGAEAPPADPWAFVGPKHRVTQADGTLDVSASFQRTSAALASMERRMGEVGTRPLSWRDYVPEGLPEGIDAHEIMRDPGMEKFLERLHAKGLTNSQVSEVLSMAYGEFIPAVQQALRDSERDAVDALVQEWGDPLTVHENTRQAYHAAEAIAARAGLSYDDIEAAGLGNNATFIRLMHAIAPEIGEDRSPTNALGGRGRRDIEQAQRDPAYTDPRHPDHERVSAEVRSYFERTYPGIADERH